MGTGVDTSTVTSEPVPPTTVAQLGAMPDTRAVNFYTSDHYLDFVLRRRLSATERALAVPRLTALGARIGGEIEDLAAAADRETPVLCVRDRRGEPVNDVNPSRAYRALERIFYGEYGLAAMALRPGVLDAANASSLVLNDAFIYIAEQGEAGLFCPLSMTRALARVLLKFAPTGVAQAYLPQLLATDMEHLYTGAMFMTEKQGGSDLGVITASARPSARYAGWWELKGEKWFCSNAGADVALVLARPEGAGPGTRGLGLFLLPKRLPDGSRNAYRIERLKDKLGMRSFASGEITLDGALAQLIGGPGEGWHQMTDMVNMTRLGTAWAAAALARRAFVESLTHARGRLAFGQALADLPLMREQLLDMQLDVEALTALCFEGSAQLAAADAGDVAAAPLARLLVPLAKYHVADEGRRVVAGSIEVRGGNGYIGEWPNARLLRDVHVQAIWEGTGNIAALDVGRAIAHQDAGAALSAALRRRVDRMDDTAVARAARIAVHALDAVDAAIVRLGTYTRAERELVMVRLTRQLARAVTAVLLLEDAQAMVREGGGYRCLLQALRYLRRDVLLPRGGPAAELDDTALRWFDALVDWTPVVPLTACEPLLAALEADL